VVRGRPKRRHACMRRDVAHLSRAWMRLNAADCASQNPSNSRKWPWRSCAFKHAQLGQFLRKEDQSRLHARCKDCSLTWAAWRLLNVFGAVRCVGAMQGVHQVDCAEQGSPVQDMQPQSPIRRISRAHTLQRHCAHALQALLRGAWTHTALGAAQAGTNGAPAHRSACRCTV
jgi:hypothetical protein